MSGMGYQMFGFAASVVSTLFLTQVIYGWLKDAMPSAKMRALDALLFETEALLRSALEEGTIDYAQYDRCFRSRIWAAKVRSDRYRADVYNITGRWHELRYWLSGMSSKISAVMDSLYTARGHVAASSSRGRQRLAKVGCTANPTLDKYSRRDTVSNLVLPDPPANASLAVPLDLGTIDNKDAFTSDSATSRVTELVQHAPAYSTLHHELSPAEQPAVDCKAHALPPLTFQSKEKAGRGIRRIERYILNRCSKHSSDIDSVHGGCKESSGFPSPFRIFSDFFHRSSATHSATAAFPAPLPPSVFAEKETRVQTAHWEVYGHVVLQVKLPV